MNKKTIISASIIAVAVIGTAIYLQKRRGSTRFKRKAVRNAKKEWKEWNVPSKKTETDSYSYPRLEKYWATVKNTSWDASDDAWSAVFISYIMKEANMKDDFPYSARHSDYITKAINNKTSSNKSKLQGYRLNEKKVAVGDLICSSRESTSDLYTRRGKYKSHCDIVVKKNREEATVIGGNLANSVSQKKVPLANGFVKEGGKRFVLIKTK